MYVHSKIAVENTKTYPFLLFDWACMAGVQHGIAPHFTRTGGVSFLLLVQGKFSILFVPQMSFSLFPELAGVDLILKHAVYIFHMEFFVCLISCMI